jgi:hypothetical protein
MSTNLTAGTTPLDARPTTATALAASLREIAARIDALGDRPLPGLAPSLDLQLWGSAAAAARTIEERVAAVDALAAALGAGECHHHNGSYRRQDSTATVAGIGLSIYAPNVEPDPRDVEIARLRAELAARGGAS